MVLAVAHGKRRPGYRADRLPEWAPPTAKARRRPAHGGPSRTSKWLPTLIELETLVAMRLDIACKRSVLDIFAITIIITRITLLVHCTTHYSREHMSMCVRVPSAVP